ncbi:MAG: DUF2007 domain-containing protein [Mariprofundaceae bacterium]
MQLLCKMSDPVLLQILSDSLEEKRIIFRIDNAGINSLMPLPGVIEARILVDDRDMLAAQQVLSDLGENE